MNTFKTLAINTAIALLFTSCGMMGEGTGGGGRVVSNNARLNLGGAGFAPKVLSPMVAIQTNQIDGAYRSTPVNLAGDLCYAFLSLGELGPGMFPMTWLAPAESFPDGPRSGSCSTVQFDLAQPEIILGKLKIPESAGDMPARKEIIRAELNFNYVDASFVVGEGDSAQTYVIRTVFTFEYSSPDVDGVMKSGDKLILLPGETMFRWANASGTSASRDSVLEGLIQEATVTEIVPGDGNQDYVPVTANFPNPVAVEYDALSDTTKVWTLSFLLQNAIVWDRNPELYSTPQEWLAGFRLKFGPNRSTTYGEDDDGIRSQLYID